LFRRLADRFNEDGIELPKSFRRHDLEQRFAIGKMPVGGRLRNAEFFRQRLETDGFRAAPLRFLQCRLHQRVPKVAVVIGVGRFAG